MRIPPQFALSSSSRRRSPVSLSLLLLLLLLLLNVVVVVRRVGPTTNTHSMTTTTTTTVRALPLSPPYIAYRTDPYSSSSTATTNTNTTTSMFGSSGDGGITTVIHHDKYHWLEEYHREYQQQQQQQQQKFGITTNEHHLFRYDNINNEVFDHRHCPLSFTIGTSQRLHSSTSTSTSTEHDDSTSSSPPLILPIPPRHDRSYHRKQIAWTTRYEHLDLYYSTTSSSTSSARATATGRTSSRHRDTTPRPKNRLLQDPYHPILLESSILTHLQPILYDINYDGVYDMIVTDYDGGITVISSSSTSNTVGTNHHHHAPTHRALHHAQVPRLYIRREWMEHYRHHDHGENETASVTTTLDSTTANGTDPDHIPPKKKTTKSLHDPFHSYFEYYYATNQGQNPDLIRGQSVNLLHQDSTTHETLQDHRRRNQVQQRQAQDNYADETKRRLLQQPLDEPLSTSSVSRRDHRRLQEEEEEAESNENRDTERNTDHHVNTEMTADDVSIPELVDPTVDDVNDDDAAILRDIDDQHHQAVDRNPHHDQEEEEERDGEVLPHHQPPHDDPILEDIRRKQDERLKQESLKGDDAMAAANHHDPAIIEDVDQMPRGMGDDMAAYDGEGEYAMDDYAMYARHGDDMYPGGGGGGSEHHDYYDSDHYIRLPPHILTTPTLVELPKLYSNDKYEKEDLLFVAVSYYFDEDEYDGLLSSYQRFQNTDIGDETEARRGSYVANAIMVYVIGSDGGTSQRWMGQTHLDLSSDYTAPENVTVVGSIPIHSDVTQMSALALSSPTVVDLNGDGKPEVIIGTNMGYIYVFDARQMLLQREHWPIQLLHPIEHPILVEDVLGTTDLEMFVTDVGGTLACLNHRAEVLWQHNLVLYLPLNTEHNIDPTATSPMSLGDVDGDGFLDIVQVIRTQHRSFVFAVTASTGNMLMNYPIELDGKISLDDEAEEVHYKLTQPLLVDLHTDQTFLNAYIHRKGGTPFTRTTKTIISKTTKDAVPHGGIGSGLHIVIPHGDAMFIVEGATVCTHKIEMGTEVSAMVQADDLHGTDLLDLVVITGSGSVMTFETATPYHPLNTWTGGSARNHRSTSHTHGYSASQGIYVHDSTRQYTDIFGVYVPITFEIFDNRPNIQNEPERRQYVVEVRDGPSWKRALWRNTYNATGVYSERVYIRYGPGYYTLYVTMQTSHGLMYEDTFSIGYNIHYLDGLDVFLWLPLLIAAIFIFLFGASKRPNWNSRHDIDEHDDNDIEHYDNGRDGHSLGILGRAQLPT